MSSLVHRVFSTSQPILGVDTLQTKTEKNEHKRVCYSPEGLLVTARNLRAREPEILWKGEVDAADCFTLISLLHLELVNCVTTNLNSTGWSRTFNLTHAFIRACLANAFISRGLYHSSTATAMLRAPCVPMPPFARSGA